MFEGVCDREDYCTGSNATCIGDNFWGSSKTCRAAQGDCDVAEKCDGTGVNCPVDTKLSGTTCRPSATACDKPETCDGKSLQWAYIIN